MAAALSYHTSLHTLRGFLEDNMKCHIAAYYISWYLYIYIHKMNKEKNEYLKTSLKRWLYIKSPV